MSTTIRQTPIMLSAGRYWITIPHDDQYGTWLGWLDAFRDHVHVENTSSRDAEGDAPAWDFYIFTSDQPLIWERGDHPTVAGKRIQSYQDTVQRPDPEKDVTDQIADRLNVGNLFAGFGNVLAAGIAVAIFIAVVRMKGKQS